MKDYEADTFEKQLREMRVPFAKMQIKGMGEKSEFVYLTRGRSENNDQDIPDDSYYSTKDGVVYSKNMDKILFYPRSKRNTEYILPDSVVSIGKYAFQNTKYLKKLICNSTLSHIEEFAFDNSSIKEFITGMFRASLVNNDGKENFIHIAK